MEVKPLAIVVDQPTAALMELLSKGSVSGGSNKDVANQLRDLADALDPQERVDMLDPKLLDAHMETANEVGKAIAEALAPLLGKPKN